MAPTRSSTRWSEPDRLGNADNDAERPFLQLVAGCEATVRVSGALVRPGRPVAAQHLPRPPAGEPHQVALCTTGLQPVVGEGVAELMRMQPDDAGLAGSATKHVRDPIRCQWTL